VPPGRASADVQASRTGKRFCEFATGYYTTRNRAARLRLQVVTGTRDHHSTKPLIPTTRMTASRFPFLPSSRRQSRRKKTRGRRRASGRTRAPWRRWLLWAVLVFLLASVLPVILMRWIPPPTSAVMLARTLGEGRSQDYQWVPLERIAPAAALAVVAAEDQKFPNHRGFDFDAILDAAEDHARGGRLRGASTLTQQVAKNLFLWQGRSYLRKGLEAWMTVLLEIVWPKRRILEVYLNIAEMGERTFGVQAASRRYFARQAANINASQAALLAAVLPNPHRFRVDHPSNYVLDRRDRILQQMSLLGDGYLRGILSGTGR
jgi:monofunctional biosynthetic peptidoglycan transglycosylase